MNEKTIIFLTFKGYENFLGFDLQLNFILHNFRTDLKSK